MPLHEQHRYVESVQVLPNRLLVPRLPSVRCCSSSRPGVCWDCTRSHWFLPPEAERYYCCLAVTTAPDQSHASRRAQPSTFGRVSGFHVRLASAEYASEYFQTPDSECGRVITALRTVERWVGQDANVLRNAYLSNSLPPTQRDFTGYNVSYEVHSGLCFCHALSRSACLCQSIHSVCIG